MPDRPTEENALRVVEMIQSGLIPNSELTRLISRFGGGDPLLAYWEGNVPGKGMELLEIVRRCYRLATSVDLAVTKESICADLSRRHEQLAHLLYSGFVWTARFGIDLSEPQIYDPTGLSYKVTTDRSERLDSLLDRLFVWFNATYATENMKPRTWHPKDRASETVGDEKRSRPNWALDDLPTLPKFDPWHPAGLFADDQDVWFAFPRDLGNSDRNFLFDAQRSVLGSLMRWLATFARYDIDDRIIELRHLIETIVAYGNFIWGVEWSEDGKRIRPIVIVKAVSTMPAQASSSSRIPLGCD